MTRHQPRSSLSPEALKRKRKSEQVRNTAVDPNRKCSVCGGKLSARNQSGICAKTYECRVQQQLKRQGGKHIRPPKGDSVWLLPPAYEIDEEGNQLTGPDGQPIEIVDEVAIRVAVSGVRRVPLTEHERNEVIKKMIQTGWQYREIADHIGTSPKKLKPMIEALGFKLIPRRQPGSSHPREATEIRRVVDSRR